MNENLKGQSAKAASAKEIINEGVNLIVNELKGNDFAKKQIDRFGGCTIVGTQNTDPSINLYFARGFFSVKVTINKSDLFDDSDFVCKNVADFFASFIKKMEG